MQKGMYIYIHDSVISHCNYIWAEGVVYNAEKINSNCQNISLIALSRTESQSVILYLGKIVRYSSKYITT
jgi:hypothetical protein